jgi:hypothetical protein
MLTRRHFLQLLGISAASVTIDPLQVFVPRLGDARLTPNATRFVGRILVPTSLYESSTSLNLMSNRVHPILDINGEWIRIPHGFVAKRDIQPIPVEDYNPPLSTENSRIGDHQGAWFSAAAPLAAIYSFAHASAPIHTTIGHGGVVQVIDYLPPESSNAVGWYGVSDDSGALLGWTQAHLWREVDEAAPPVDFSRHIEIDLSALSLTAFQSDEWILSAPITTNRAALRGEYSVEGRQLSGSANLNESVQLHGVPYLLHFGENGVLSGAYWHNSFGDSSDMTGHAIQVPVYVARWLYNWLPDGAPVVIH